MTTKKDLEVQDGDKSLSEALETGLALSLDDIGNDAGAGFEGTDKDSYAIPFLSVLQKGSPQCDEADAKWIEGAKEGLLFNSVNSRLYDGKEGVLFLPAAYQRRFIHWGPRGQKNGGFKGEMLPERAFEMRDSGKVIEHDGKWLFPLADGVLDKDLCERLVDTRNHFGILIDPSTNSYSNVVISLTSSQIRKSKNLLSLLSEVKIKSTTGKLVTPPTWYNKVRVVTVSEKNDRGNWRGVKFDLEGFCTSTEMYEAAKGFHKALTSGTAAPVQYADPDGEKGEDIPY